MAWYDGWGLSEREKRALDRAVAAGHQGAYDARTADDAVLDAHGERLVCGICGEPITQGDVAIGEYAEMYDPASPLVEVATDTYGSLAHAHVTCHAQCGINKGFECA